MSQCCLWQWWRDMPWPAPTCAGARADQRCRRRPRTGTGTGSFTRLVSGDNRAFWSRYSSTTPSHTTPMNRPPQCSRGCETRQGPGASMRGRNRCLTVIHISALLTPSTLRASGTRRRLVRWLLGLVPSSHGSEWPSAPNSSLPWSRVTETAQSRSLIPPAPGIRGTERGMSSISNSGSAGLCTLRRGPGISRIARTHRQNAKRHVKTPTRKIKQRIVALQLMDAAPSGHELCQSSVIT
jgi:hypothetical protein